jgi:Arc/MetJ-type ribon-helix-helix transcriptional regulator
VPSVSSCFVFLSSALLNHSNIRTKAVLEHAKLNSPETKAQSASFRTKIGHQRTESEQRRPSRLKVDFPTNQSRLEVVALPRYCSVGNMEITLAKDVEGFLQQKVQEGVCADASDLVNDVLRAVRDQQSSAFTTTPELEAWLLEAADTPSTPLTPTDFAQIRHRVQPRGGSSAK